MTRAPVPVLLTDLYQLTMLQSYWEHGQNDTAVFEFFVRKLPQARNFIVAAGLQQVLEYLRGLRFSAPELEWLRQSGRFSAAFVDALAELRFTGEVHAMAEGTPFFPDEPILRLTAPLMQAQLVESRIINLLHFQTLVASKAARIALAAPGKLLVDFGLRRTHGAEAGLLAARAAYLAGFAGSSTVEAGRLFDIPLYGTMAHSFVQAHASEEEAFVHFAESHPHKPTLLIDTYDTLAGARKVVALAPQLAARGIDVGAVRLDSGDLGALAYEVRAIFDAAGLTDIRILASGNLDEYAVRKLEDDGAPIDGYGVGTRMNTSADAPYLDCAYKLQEYAGLARRKRSEGKATWPGRKQVYRRYDEGRLARDVITVEGDAQPGVPLLRPFMREGELLEPYPPLALLRERTAANLAALPPGLRALGHAEPYAVQIADALRRLATEVDARTTGGNHG